MSNSSTVDTNTWTIISSLVSLKNKSVILNYETINLI